MDPCRYHAGFETGYKALHQPLLHAMALDPTVTVAAVLHQLAENDTDYWPERCRDDGDRGLPGRPGPRPRPGHAAGRGRPRSSGKSTYAQTAAVDGVVCLDSLRREISGDFSVKFSVLN
ncbi:hypothetical protein ABZY16_25280 [Streptomyces sp. NPDC006553]|uniref:hypothetical protein n=1 Tax=Streptomyces sp. NPDC006553 TaxID=3157180 RepID=UPI0033B0BFAA